MSSPDAQHRLSLRLHGEPAVLRADGSPAILLEPRAAALLALVALEPGVARQRVATLLWPDSDDPRRNLRQQLLRLRRALGDAPLIEGDSALHLTTEVTTDVDAEGAAPLLGHLNFDDNADLQAWLDAQRARTRHDVLRKLQAEVDAAQAQGRLDEALDAAQRLLALDSASEAHHRTLMQLHYLRGDRAAGMAVYERFARWLAATHGAQPDGATQAVARALRESTAPTTQLAVPQAKMPPVTLLRPPRMIGRERELGALRDAWAQQRAALVLGEPGLGKSRLLAEFGAGKGMVAVQGRPGDAGVPFATLARWLRKLREAHTPALTVAQTEVIAQLLPESAQTVRAGGASAAGDSRLALHSALTTWLAQAQARGLSGAAVDDLHFADDASLETLRALIGSADLARLHWVLATRPAEGGAAVEALRGELAEARLLDTVTLRPLGVPEMTALVASLGIEGLDAQALGEPLARHCGGNPLYALETLKQGLADGTLLGGRLPHPMGVGELIERRLKQLSEGALALARVAAVAGVDFDIALAEAVTGRSAVDLASAWAALESAQVLREGAFAHDLVHDAVLRTVPTAIARRLHEQCAEHLRARSGEPARLAEHWLRAGRARDAAEAFIEAAKRAQRAGRRVEEAALLAKAAQCFFEAHDGVRRFDALADRLSALIQADFGERATQAADELLALAAEDRQRLRALREQVDLYNMRGQLAQTIEIGQRALALARSMGDAESQVRVACSMTTSLCFAGRANEAYDALLPLAGWARQSAPVDVRQLYLAYWAITLDNLGRLREAVAAYEESSACAREAGLPPGAVASDLSNLAVTYNKMGRVAQAVDASERAVRVIRDDPDAKGQPLLMQLTLARHLFEDGRYGPALQIFEEVLDPIDRSGAPIWSFAARLWLGTLWLRLGQPARATPLLAASADGMPAPLRATHLALRAMLAQATGERGSRALIEPLATLIPGETGPGLTARIVEARYAEPSLVLEQAPRWIDLAHQAERYGLELQARVWLAVAASATGDSARGATSAREAMALLSDGINSEPMYRAEAWLLCARALDAAGLAEEATACVRVGADWVTQRALPHVPAPFVDSFLNRNTFNRDLLARAAAVW